MSVWLFYFQWMILGIRIIFLLKFELLLLCNCWDTSELFLRWCDTSEYCTAIIIMLFVKFDLFFCLGVYEIFVLPSISHYLKNLWGMLLPIAFPQYLFCTKASYVFPLCNDVYVILTSELFIIFQILNNAPTIFCFLWGCTMVNAE